VFNSFDGNGSVAGLIMQNGSVSARSEYGPFGEPIRVTGRMAQANPFLWSTKFAISGLKEPGREAIYCKSEQQPAMPRSSHQMTSSAARGVEFAETQWSVVLRAQGLESSEARRALNTLCKTYWYPLYAFIRRRGYDREDAKDLTQEFFSRLLRNDFLRSVDRAKGRFRSFLLASVKNLLANEWDRARTHRRGGQYTIVSWDEDVGEDRYRQEPGHDLTADRLFERSWALVLLETTLKVLQAEYTAAGQAALFQALEPCLSGERQALSYAELGARMGMTEAAVKMTVLRLRRRYGQLLRAKVAGTVHDPREVEDELHHLFTALGR
jgi:RNA polymerase sigma-70 factor (ECF subfamily)